MTISFLRSFIRFARQVKHLTIITNFFTFILRKEPTDRYDGGYSDDVFEVYSTVTKNIRFRKNPGKRTDCIFLIYLHRHCGGSTEKGNEPK